MVTITTGEEINSATQADLIIGNFGFVDLKETISCKVIKTNMSSKSNCSDLLTEVAIFVSVSS